MLTAYAYIVRKVLPMQSSLTLAVAGALYLILAVCGGFSELVVRSSVRVPGDATATADNIRASAGLFRLGWLLVKGAPA